MNPGPARRRICLLALKMRCAKPTWSSTACPTSSNRSWRFSGWWTAWRRRAQSSPRPPFSSPSPIWPVAPTGGKNASPSPLAPHGLCGTGAGPGIILRAAPCTSDETVALLSISSASSASARWWNGFQSRAPPLVDCSNNSRPCASLESSLSRQDTARYDHRCSHPADQQLALVDHLRRQVVVQVDEQLFVPDHLLAPGRAVHFLQFRRTARAGMSSPAHSMSS